MKSICSNCDLGLKRSDCSDTEYIECACRHFIIKELNQTTLTGFIHILDDALEAVYENEKDLKNNKIRMAIWLNKGVLE